MSNHDRTAPASYRKADSFVALSGGGENAGVVERLRALSARVERAPAAHRAIVARACAEALAAVDNAGESLSANDTRDGATFRLRPFLVEEIRRLRDENELIRYLFYRYRYDVFPPTRQLDDFPPCVQIEPTSMCNFRCVFCYQTDRMLTRGRHGHMGMMDIDTFRAVVDQIEGHVEAVTLASRGEPMLAKQIVPMLAYLSGKFLALKINTNASLLTEKKAHALLAADPNTVVFSADAADPELYSRLRVNGSLDTVLANVRMFDDIRARHYPGSRTITRVSGVRYSDEQRFDDIEAFWHDYVDQVAFVAYNPWENPYDQPANGIAEPCSDLWRRAFVWWDGTVNPCDVDYRSNLATGNALETPLSEVWRGEAYEALRAAHLAGARQCRTPCAGCVVV